MFETPAATRLRDRIKNFDAESDSEEALQHWQEALDAMSTSPMDQDERSVDVARLIAAIFNTLELTGIANPVWHTVVLSPLFKDKVDPMVVLPAHEIKAINCDLDHWREVAQADGLRTLYGSCVHNAWCRFSLENELHGFTQLGYLPGMDSIAIHHMKFDLVQSLSLAKNMPWSQHPLNMAGLATDFKHFFSTFTSDTRESTMSENQFPGPIVNGQRAIHEGMNVAMIDGGVLTPKIAIGCELMGSAEACVHSTAVFSAYNEGLKRAGKGFKLPPSEQFGLAKAPAENLFAGDQCDDITLFSGGYGRSVRDTIEHLEWQAGYTARWAAANNFIFSVDVQNALKSKSVAFAVLTDEYGYRVSVVINIWLPTQEGLQRVPMLPDNEAFKMLGVMRSTNPSVQVARNVQNAAHKTVSKLKLVVNSKFPVGAQSAALGNSATGGLRWIAEKTALPWKSILLTVAQEAREAKKVLGLSISTLTSYVFADKSDGGCGQTSTEAIIMAQGTAALIQSLNSRHEYVRNLMRYQLDVCRLAAGIDLKQGAPFFEWDCEGLNPDGIDNMGLPTSIATALRFSFCYGAAYLWDCTERVWLIEFTWKASYYLTHDTAVIKGIIKDIFASKWKHELMSCGIDAAAKEALNSLQQHRANAWRSDRSLNDKVVRTAIKAAIDALPTGQNIARWNGLKTPRVSAACHCGHECASAAHIFQLCPCMHFLITKRSAKVVDICLRAVSMSKASNWSYIGKPGCHPPGFLLPHNWQSKLQCVQEIKNGIITWVQHRLPDLLLSCAAAGGRYEAVIADVSICWSDIEAAKARKHRAYSPLKELMLANLPDGSKVTILPIIFTSRGTPPEDWTDICNVMKFKLPADIMLKRIQTVVLNYLDEIMSAWSRQSFARTNDRH